MPTRPREYDRVLYPVGSIIPYPAPGRTQTGAERPYATVLAFDDRQLRMVPA